MNKPPKMDAVSAELTTTPFAYFDGKWWRYFGSLEKALAYRGRERGTIYRVTKEL